MLRKFTGLILVGSLLTACGIYGRDGKLTPESRATPMADFFRFLDADVDEEQMRAIEAQADAAALEDEGNTQSLPNG